MRESLTGNYYEMLRYFGSGNYSKLIRCFRISLQNFNLNLSKELFSLYRQRTSLFLNSLGLLELDVDKPNNFSWSACEGYIVMQESSKVMCVGGTILTNEFIKAVKTEHIDFHSPGYQPKEFEGKIFLFPDFPIVTLSESKAKHIATLLKCRYVHNPAQNIAQILRPLKIISKELSHKIDALPDDPDLDQFFMSDVKSPWRTLVNGDYSSPGFYRRKRIDGRFDYFVISGRNNNYAVFRIESTDWSHLIAYNYLSENIYCDFNPHEQTLCVPQSIRLPRLIERILIANSFSLPSFKKDGVRTYSKVNQDLVNILHNQLPVFNIAREA